MLRNAAHKDTRVMFGAHLYDVKKGEFITSERDMAKDLLWSQKKVRAFLMLLEKDQMITREKNHRSTTITILNYCLYNNNGIAKESERNRQGIREESDGNRSYNKETLKTLKKEYISPALAPFLERYANPDLIMIVFQALETIDGKPYTDAIKLDILSAWESYPAGNVEGGISAYFEKGFQNEGKGRHYLTAMIKNFKPGKAGNDSGPGADQWECVMAEVRRVGNSESPRFDDPVTKKIVTDMGWSTICQSTDKTRPGLMRTFLSMYKDKSVVTV